jgi:hypothetical protein
MVLCEVKHFIKIYLFFNCALGYMDNPELEKVGFAVEGASVSDVINKIKLLKMQGIKQVWMTSGAAGGASNGC